MEDWFTFCGVALRREKCAAFAAIKQIRQEIHSETYLKIIYYDKEVLRQRL